MDAEKINTKEVTTEEGKATICWNTDATDLIPLGKYYLDMRFTATDGTDYTGIEIYNLIVGHKMECTIRQPVIPFDTIATTEDDITDAEKLATSFQMTITAYDKTTGLPAQGVRFEMGVIAGKNTNIYQESRYSTNGALQDLWDNETTRIAWDEDHITDKNGQCIFGKITFQKLFTNVDGIKQYNALLFRCIGTTNLEPNFLPIIAPTPLLAGTQPCIMFITPQTVEVEGDGIVCGGGGIELDVDLHYHFPYSTADHEIRDGGEFYQDWDDSHIPEPTGKSSEYFMIEETTGYGTEDWKPVPYSRVKQAENGPQIKSTGDGYAAIAMDTGGCRFIYINNKKFSDKGRLNYRMVYTGAVGAREKTTGDSYTLQIAPTHPTTTKMDVILDLFDTTSGELTLYRYTDSDITLVLQRSSDNSPLSGLEDNITATFE